MPVHPLRTDNPERQGYLYGKRDQRAWRLREDVQPDSLAYRKTSGSGHSDDIARLAGIRFVNASELPNDMKLNAAIVKQITGGDTVTTRFIYKGFFEYRPQFKIFINTNHLPEVGDDSLFSSGRLKLIPFDRHFEDSEQDKGLKSLFRVEDSKSAILNWLLAGYKQYNPAPKSGGTSTRIPQELRCGRPVH